MGSFQEMYKFPISFCKKVGNKKECVKQRSLQPLPEEENYIDCHLEYPSVLSRIVDLEERGHEEARKLCDVALDKGLKHFMV